MGADDGVGEGTNKHELGKKKVGFSIQYLMSLMKGYDNSDRKNMGKSIAIDRKITSDLKMKKKPTHQEGENYDGVNDEDKFFESERTKYKADMKTAEKMVVIAPSKSSPRKEVPKKEEKKVPKNPNPAGAAQKQEADDKENLADNSDEKEKSDVAEQQANDDLVSQFQTGESQERSMGYLKNIKMLKVIIKLIEANRFL